LVIANAIYFKGTWSQPFDADDTKPAAFTLSNLEKIETPLMNRRGFHGGRYAAFHADGSLFETPQTVTESFQDEQGYPAADGFQIAELPYNGDALSMMVVLPRKADGLAELVRTLTPQRLQECVRLMDSRMFHLSLPKFKLESTYRLNDCLQRMGMKQAFDSTQADFSGLTDSRDPDHELHISLVLHKAFVDVNEQGTEAAAATIVALEPRAAALTQRPFVPSFTADHPFLFFIRERSTGLILFIGKVEKP
jgi:serpin B